MLTSISMQYPCKFQMLNTVSDGHNLVSSTSVLETSPFKITGPRVHPS